MHSRLKSHFAPAQYLRVSSIEAGVKKYYNPVSMQPEAITITKSWMATRVISSDDFVTLVCIYTPRWVQGILLIAPMMETPLKHLDDTLQMLEPIELSDWNDPVKGSLQEINLFPSEATNYISETEVYPPWDFIIQFSTGFTRGAFEINRYTPETPKLIMLGQSINQAIRYFGEQYKDNEVIRNYLVNHHLFE